MLGDRQAENAVAEKSQAAIGVGALVDPGRVRQRLPAQRRRQRVEQLAQCDGTTEAHGYPGRCAMTKSTASATVSICAACSSETLTP